MRFLLWQEVSSRWISANRFVVNKKNIRFDIFLDRMAGRIAWKPLPGKQLLAKRYTSIYQK
jgi:hypothetical protein